VSLSIALAERFPPPFFEGICREIVGWAALFYNVNLTAGPPSNAVFYNARAGSRLGTKKNL
jgi:hypothetical protein